MEAVIDIGSNSVRLLLDKGKPIQQKEVATTTLAEGLATAHVLSDEAMTRTARAVMVFVLQARHRKARRIHIFATEAVRVAENGDKFVEIVEKLSGIPVKVLSGAQEAVLGLLGAAGGDPYKEAAVLDIGGASAELITGAAANPGYSKSLPLGVVRIKEDIGDDRAALEHFAHNAVKSYGNVHAHVLTAIGGSATSLGAMHLDLKKYDAKKIHGLRLSLDDVDTLIDEIFAYPCLTERYKTLSEKRAQVIKQGAVLLAAVMRHIGAEQVVISEQDNMDGYLYAFKSGLPI